MPNHLLSSRVLGWGNFTNGFGKFPFPLFIIFQNLKKFASTPQRTSVRAVTGFEDEPLAPVCFSGVGLLNLPQDRPLTIVRTSILKIKKREKFWLFPFFLSSILQIKNLNIRWEKAAWYHFLIRYFGTLPGLSWHPNQDLF